VIQSVRVVDERGKRIGCRRKKKKKNMYDLPLRLFGPKNPASQVWIYS
jgi:hypothetical protein